MPAIKIRESGCLVANKPEGISTYDLIRILKKRFRFKKIGHTGTLDPFASGVVVICINEAVKISQFLQEGVKGYLVKMGLWKRTDTFDLTGSVIEEKEPVEVNEQFVAQCLASFVGRQKQMVPPFSAVKYKGKPLYEYARKNIVVELPEKWITIHKIEPVKIGADFIEFYAEVSKGTYIRRLVDDIGLKLGFLGYTVSLKRIKNSGFSIEESININEIKTREQLLDSLLSISDSLKNFDSVEISKEQAEKFIHGQSLKISVKSKGKYVKVFTNSKLVGIGFFDDYEVLKPKRIIFE